MRPLAELEELLVFSFWVGFGAGDVGATSALVEVVGSTFVDVETTAFLKDAMSIIIPRRIT